MSKQNSIELHRFYIHLNNGDLRQIYVTDSDVAMEITKKIRSGTGMLSLHLVTTYHTKMLGQCYVYDEAEGNVIDNVLVINLSYMIYAAIGFGCHELDEEYHPLTKKM